MKPSGEVEVYVPPALRKDGPCAIVYPVAGDGSYLTVGVIRSKAVRKFTTSPPVIPETTSPRLPVTRQPLRLLTSARYSPEWLPQSPHVGLAVALTAADRDVIPTGNEQDVTTIYSEDLRTAQAADDTFQRLLIQTGIPPYTT
jgi:hypothetical protein